MLSNRTRHCCSIAAAPASIVHVHVRVEVVDLFGPMLYALLAIEQAVFELQLGQRHTVALSQRPPTAPRLVLLRVLLLLPLTDCYNRESEDVQLVLSCSVVEHRRA